MSHTHLYLDQPDVAAPQPQVESVLPLQLAVPFILALSLALWVVLWKLGAWSLAVVNAWLG
ncbi:hypothetical protein [Limobrevibacterium gyesilva]|uniref:Uncharacterized protein n=1 Tax=Limobrevibacterium gyesilva TaxID=2991712 RepID=A0AA42CJH9_9PROT|nr:hypothetical protein [Limobrevibacterium gyesilva]MCW3476885.1 hypothetical protein [Limobrevibacterium gyesilva]